ncbi:MULTISPECIES: LuxR C-terminal-related transcriptional regulator [Burkholderia]|uniref:LuxR C-terminal-related transcriptional regulator n=1 Tax=Burkholderia TaxID=32008 RepID=UPI0009B5460B|nr:MULTISPECIES: LuxR C-terminal-related transcriptional regulator [Burkholderia]RQS24186.1 LuxR family transcriptional regulator [Burkholderia sp. Bp8995]RQS38915.1 LuxR family transcriptional regulator [Burkholderia sp. Bp8989]
MDFETLDPQLVLKTTPPRMSDSLIPRGRLALDHLGLSHKPAIVIQAPAGFGKTSLLMQWRRSAQGAGAVVIWFTADESDDAKRFARAIGYGLTNAKTQKGSEPTFLRWLRDQESGMAALTGLLAQISDQPFDTVVIVDNAERSGGDGLHDALAYLIRNAPANLQVIIGARTGAVLDIPEIADHNIVARLSNEELTFTYDETIAAIGKHFGNKVGAEAAGRLHEQTEGWPLGLQLVIATLKKSLDVHAAIRGISASAGDVQRYFVENLIGRLAPDLCDFLTRIAIFDMIHPELCAAVFPGRDVSDMLVRLERDTPVFMHAEGVPWMRMHALARDFLLTRFHALPTEEQRQISERACTWLTAHAFYEEAARHALLAGQEDVAYELAEKTLYQIGYRGNLSEVLKWVDRLPPPELRRRPALWTAAAWSLALTNRRREAERVVEYIVSEYGDDAQQQFEAALIKAVAASFDDQPERFLESIGPAIIQSPPALDEKTGRIYKNVLGFLSFQQGDLGKARHFWVQAAQARSSDAADYSSGFAEFGIGLSYLWEGQFRTVEQYMRAALTRCEQEMGRRNPVCSMMAAVLAAALWELGGTQEPQAILSYRLDVLERAGVPEAIMLAYLTLSRLAMQAGQEPRALEYLDAMAVLGETRAMPRLQIAAVCEQVRLHARAARPETVARLCRKLDEVCHGLNVVSRTAIDSWVTLHRSRALAYQALALRDWTAALEHLTVSAACADRMSLGRDSVEIRLLRAVALRCSTEGDVSELFKESLSLARACGMVRTLLDTHPDALDSLREISKETDFRVGDLIQGRSVDRPAPVETDTETKHGGTYANALLTSKEREILDLIARSMSNKQIAIALDISAGTVKWHVKNIFAKLDAGTRAHAVKRANLLGIL